MSLYLPLGEPPWDDVEEAAVLLAKYENAGLTEEGWHMFMRMVEQPGAVRARAREILSALPPRSKQ